MIYFLLNILVRLIVCVLFIGAGASLIEAKNKLLKVFGFILGMIGLGFAWYWLGFWLYWKTEGI